MCYLFLDFSLFTWGCNLISFPVLLDTYSLSFGFSVRFVAGAVIVFSSLYIKSEKFSLRFHALVRLFVIRIFFLIYSPNLIRLLLGWDGLGVTSYLLVIYFNSHKSLNAGLITALTNRLGDCLILISIASLITFTPLNFFLYNSSIVTIDFLLIVFLIVAATTKRAQIPFSAWLPAAIAAPTPVSSLVHSSTLVTAGVYVIIRFSGLIPEKGFFYLVVIGVITLTIARIGALLETDLKKIVALSTLSQLGLIIVSVGVDCARLALFHLLTHAYFKAILFIRVGNIIHLGGGDQDLRLSQVYSQRIFITPAYRLIANIRLIGMPFLAGFYSKDFIIEKLRSSCWGLILVGLILLSIALTARYRVRFILMLIWSQKTLRVTIQHIDVSWFNIISIGILHPLAIFGGTLISWVLIPFLETLIVPKFLKIFILILIILGALSGVYFSQIFQASRNTIRWARKSLWGLFFIRGRVSGPVLTIGDFFKANADLKWIPIITIFPILQSKIFRLPHRRVLLKTQNFIFLIVLFSGLFIIY